MGDNGGMGGCRRRSSGVYPYLGFESGKGSSSTILVGYGDVKEQQLRQQRENFAITGIWWQFHFE